MRSLFIMGLPRGGTTVTRDLFEGIPGLTVLEEINPDVLAQHIAQGPVVWKSPANCMDGLELERRFPEAVQAYVIRDGRQNLAAHKRYLEVYGIDYLWGAYRGWGLKGFTDLWNDYARVVLTKPNVFRLEAMVRSATEGPAIIRSLYGLCGFPGTESAVRFWLDHIFYRIPERYPGKAVSLETPSWHEYLTETEASWINQELLERLGYG